MLFTRRFITLFKTDFLPAILQIKDAITVSCKSKNYLRDINAHSTMMDRETIKKGKLALFFICSHIILDYIYYLNHANSFSNYKNTNAEDVNST